MATIVSLLWSPILQFAKTLSNFYNKLFSECPTHSLIDEGIDMDQPRENDIDESGEPQENIEENKSQDDIPDEIPSVEPEDLFQKLSEAFGSFRGSGSASASASASSSGSGSGSGSASDVQGSGSASDVQEPDSASDAKEAGSASGGPGGPGGPPGGPISAADVLGSVSADDDILSTGPGRTLILFVDTSESEIAHLLFVELRSGFRIIVNTFREEIPPHLREKSVREKEIHALQVAFRENKDFLKNRKFRLFVTSIPLFLHLLTASPDQLDFMKPFTFTLAFGKKDTYT